MEEEKEAALALKKLNEQIKRDKIKLEIEKEEMSMFKNNPELLLLNSAGCTSGRSKSEFEECENDSFSG